MIPYNQDMSTTVTLETTADDHTGAVTMIARLTDGTTGTLDCAYDASPEVARKALDAWLAARNLRRTGRPTWVGYGTRWAVR